jgi:hypothetical protein
MTPMNMKATTVKAAKRQMLRRVNKRKMITKVLDSSKKRRLLNPQLCTSRARNDLNF